MKFLGVTNPLKKDSVDDYTDVLIPFDQAARHYSVEAEYARRRSADEKRSPDSGKTGKITKSEDSEEGVLRTSSGNYDPHTIEGLRAEVMEEVGASGEGHDSAYDCECKLRA